MANEIDKTRKVMPNYRRFVEELALRQQANQRNFLKFVYIGKDKGNYVSPEVLREANRRHAERRYNQAVRGYNQLQQMNSTFRECIGNLILLRDCIRDVK